LLLILASTAIFGFGLGGTSPNFQSYHSAAVLLLTEEEIGRWSKLLMTFACTVNLDSCSYWVPRPCFCSF
jgi:hypothetical protein